MYKLLLVDDEIHVLQSLQSNINWEKLGISNLFIAMNIRQAKEVLLKNSIDIMLCDIEMPQGNGLDLLVWVNEHYPKTESIFLTCHAEFNYAQQAIQLGSLDYILKPVPYPELETIILKAINKISKNNELIEDSQFRKLWFEHQPLLIERFWLDIVNQTIPNSTEEIQRIAVQRNIPYSGQMRFLPILFSVQGGCKENNLYESTKLEYTTKKIAEEIFFSKVTHGNLIHLDSEKFLAILFFDNISNFSMKLLLEECEIFVIRCNQSINCDISCFIGNFAYIHEVSSVVNSLSKLENETVALNKKVFLLSEQIIDMSKMHSPDLNAWLVMLQEGLIERVLNEVTNYLQNYKNRDWVSTSVLRQFHQDFLQMIYHFLQIKGIQAHQLFCDGISIDMSTKATQTIEGLFEWVNYILKNSMDYVHMVEESLTIVNKVKKFISQNLQYNMSREEVARYVYLNPDYLSRLLKKETGLSFHNYVVEERLKLAKKLLTQSEMSISSISIHVGYSDYSQFSKVFKKHSNISPVEYRKLHK